MSSHLDDEVGKKQKLTAVLRTKLIGSGPGSDPAFADLKVKKVNKLKTKPEFFLKTLYFFSPISVFHHLIFRPLSICLVIIYSLYFWSKSCRIRILIRSKKVVESGSWSGQKRLRNPDPDPVIKGCEILILIRSKKLRDPDPHPFKKVVGSGQNRLRCPHRIVDDVFNDISSLHIDAEIVVIRQS